MRVKYVKGDIDLVFSDLFFIYLFLPLCLGLYFLRRNLNYRNAVLIAFSIVFYAWGEPVWIFLLMFSAFIDFLNGKFIEKHRGEQISKLGVVLSMLVNLGFLATFKYSGFIMDNVNALLGTALPVPSFALPIGISFYSFQSMSYVIDVYRGEVRAQKSYFKFLMYISMFFQLVAGPIVRYQTIAEEIDDRHITLSDFSDGLTRFVFGLGKKVIIANNVGNIATELLSFSDKPSSVFSIWMGVIMFSLQIFFDFSGYSDMAIGLGRMAGFHFNENFNYPYVSATVSEFWRRWHISMGSFFRDYVYIPLGGNRKHVYLNLFIVWFLTGLWHGASWNFILWGLYFGLFIALERLFLGKLLAKIPRFISHIYLLFVVVIGWALFYFTDFSQLRVCLGSMFGFAGIPLFDDITFNTVMQNLFIILAAVILSTPVVKLLGKRLERREFDSKSVFYASRIAKTSAAVVILLVSSLMLVAQTYNPFLYYRF